MTVFWYDENMKRVATIVSRVLEPIVEIPFLLVLATLTAYLNGYRWRFLALLLFLDAVVPGIYFFYLLLTKKARDWDISQRAERLPLFRLAVAMHLAGVLVAFVINREPLAQILLSFWLLALLFMFISHYWKISVHAGVNSTLAVFGIWLYGFGVWWLFLLPLFVSWARVVAGKHTVAQVALGTVLPLCLLPFFLWVLAVPGVARL